MSVAIRISVRCLNRNSVKRSSTELPSFRKTRFPLKHDEFALHWKSSEEKQNVPKTWTSSTDRVAFWTFISPQDICSSRTISQTIRQTVRRPPHFGFC